MQRASAVLLPQPVCDVRHTTAPVPRHTWSGVGSPCHVPAQRGHSNVVGSKHPTGQMHMVQPGSPNLTSPLSCRTLLAHDPQCSLSPESTRASSTASPESAHHFTFPTSRNPRGFSPPCSPSHVSRSLNGEGSCGAFFSASPLKVQDARLHATPASSSQMLPRKLQSILSQDAPESKSSVVQGSQAKSAIQSAPAPLDHSSPEPAICDVEHSATRRLAPEPWLEESIVDARRTAVIGLDSPQSHFVDGCEWIGLGSFCAVSRALQALNIKKFTYPFDWTRSPLDGVIQCFEQKFQDFCTHSSCTDHGASGKCFGGSQWGGSFWHHDPTDMKTQQDFARRIRRLYGQQEVPATKPRVFVRSVNSTSEISSVVRLEEALRRVLPQASVYLLILIDNQPSPGPMRLIGHENILFYKTGEEMFANNGATWSMLKQAEAYCEAIGFAAHFWAGSSTKVVEEGDLQQILASVTSFEGGDCNSEMFWPQRTQPCVIRGRDTGNSLTASAAGASIKVSSQSFAQRLSQSVPPPRVEPRKGVAISPALSHRHLNISNPGGFRSERPLQFCH